MKAVYIFWLRQVKRYLRSTPRIIGSLGQPILFLVALGFGLSPAVTNLPGGIDYIQYLVPGVVGLTVLFSAMFSGMELIQDRQYGFLKETLVAPVARFSIILGKALGGATVATSQGLLVLAISFLFGFEIASVLWLPVGLLVMFFIALTFCALGLSIATQLEDTQSYPLIINFVMFPLFFLSGALFPLEDIPVALDVMTTLNPLTYGVDALRAALIGSSTYPLWLGLSVTAGTALAVFAVGSYLFAKIRL
jgi:ABC-2 type transport system permease protein